MDTFWAWFDSAQFGRFVAVVVVVMLVLVGLPARASAKEQEAQSVGAGEPRTAPAPTTPVDVCRRVFGDDTGPRPTLTHLGGGMPVDTEGGE